MRNFIRNMWTSLRRGMIDHPWITVVVTAVCVIGICPELGDKLLEVLLGIGERALTIVLNKFIGFLNRNADSITSLILIVALIIVLRNMLSSLFGKKKK